MKAKFAILILLLASLPAAGAHIFVNLFETDSAELLNAGVKAFSNTANCRDFDDRFDAWMRRHMLVPSGLWLDRTRPLRFIRTVDPLKPINEENPAILTIAEMVDRGETIGRVCTELYRRKTPIGTYGALYRDPVNTNLPPQVAIAAEAKYILLSRSAEQLMWGWEYRQRFFNAPKQNIHGNFRMLINSGRFVELLPLLHPNFHRQPFVPAIMRNFKNLIVGMNFNGGSFGISVKGIPDETKELAKLTNQWQMPATDAWKKLPCNLLFSSLIGGTEPNFVEHFIPTPLDRIIWPIAPLIEKEGFVADCPTILHTTDDGKSFVFGSMRKFLPEKAKALPIDKLDAIDGKTNCGIVWLKDTTRSIDGNPVYRYRLSLTPQFAKEGMKHPDLELLKSLLLIFLKNAKLELTVRGDSLYTALGTGEPMEDCIRHLNAENHYRSLDKIIAVDDPNIGNNDLLFASSINASRLCLGLIKNFPGVNNELLGGLPEGGDGLTLAVCRGEDKSLTLSMQVQNGEIAALNLLNENVRPLITEMFFALLAENIK